MIKKKCRTDVVGHPEDGWRIEAKGPKVACDAKLAEILENSGPFNQKVVKRRWDHIEEE
jgi:hypothetical protein